MSWAVKGAILRICARFWLARLRRFRNAPARQLLAKLVTAQAEVLTPIKWPRRRYQANRMADVPASTLGTRLRMLQYGIGRVAGIQKWATRFPLTRRGAALTSVPGLQHIIRDQDDIARPLY